jgi:hypothetical protein
MIWLEGTKKTRQLIIKRYYEVEPLPDSMKWIHNVKFVCLVAETTECNLKSTVFLDRTPCSPLTVNRRFGGTSPMSSGSNKPSKILARKQVANRALYRWRRDIPPKRRMTFNGLQGVISQKILLFITTTVRTSNRTLHFHYMWYSEYDLRLIL